MALTWRCFVARRGDLNPLMKTVKIAELKNRLSDDLRRVQRGESILVCDRDRAIARIDRVGPGPAVSGHEAEWLHRLERRGILRRGTGTPTRQWVAERPHLGRDLVAALLVREHSVEAAAGSHPDAGAVYTRTADAQSPATRATDEEREEGP